MVIFQFEFEYFRHLSIFIHLKMKMRRLGKAKDVFIHFGPLGQINGRELRQSYSGDAPHYIYFVTLIIFTRYIFHTSEHTTNLLALTVLS